jgi:uncharacterized protein YegP (UPF0339 family)
MKTTNPIIYNIRLPKWQRWKFYLDQSNEWRWWCKAKNGRIIAASSEGFKRLSAAKKNAVKSGFIEPEKTK